MSFAGRVCELAVTTYVITDWNKFSHPVTSITMPVAMCTSLVYGAKRSMLAKFGDWHD